MKLFKNTKVFAVLSICLCLAGCLSDERDMETGTDLAKAEEAQRKRQNADAEMYLLRYLRTNPEGASRWQVWNNLLDLTLHVRQDRRLSRDYLEIMLVEFENQDDRRRKIQSDLADVCADIGLLERSVQLWETLVEDKGLEEEARAQVYRKLAQGYLRRLESTLAITALQECLALDISTATRTRCMYDLAETQMLTEGDSDSEGLSAAEKTLNDLLATEDIPEDQAVLAIFMLADVSEQMGKFDVAKELFESIRGRYPNPRVVDLRISYLTNRKKK